MPRRRSGGDAKGSIPGFGLKPAAHRAVYWTIRQSSSRSRTNPNDPMSENDKSKEYGQARAAFDSLKMDERAAFLVESVVAMLAEGVGEAGRVVSEVIDEMARNVDSYCSDEADASKKPDAAPADKAAGETRRSAAKASAKPGSRRPKGPAPAKE